MMKNNNNDWLKKYVERIDVDIKELREINRSEKELKRMLAKLWDDHERWLRKHDVRLGEHWKQIVRLREK